MSVDVAARDSGTEQEAGPVARLPWNGTVLSVAAGVLLLSVAYAILRAEGPYGEAVYWLGIAVLVLPTLIRLIRPLPRGEAVLNLVVLAVGTEFARILSSPGLPKGFDELLHLRTLRDINGTGGLFTPNSVLPVSPFYPGLESVSSAIHQLTGLPLNASAYATVIVTKVLLALALFEVFRLATRSPRIAAACCAVYVASPQFMSFNSQYAYQTIALPLGLGAIALAVRWSQGAHPVVAGVAVALFAGTVVSHHLTSATILLVLVAVALTSAVRREGRWRGLLAIAGLMVVVFAAWTAVARNSVLPYVDEIFSGGLRQLLDIVGGRSSGRVLFSDSSGIGTPPWERVMLTLGTLILLVLVLWGLVATWRRRAGATSLLVVLAVVGATYPFLLAGRFAPLAAEIADRASTFVFLGVAVLVGPVLARVYDGRTDSGQVARRSRWAAVLVAPTLCILFIGGFLLGSGPDSNRFTGPFLVGAGQRSVDAHQLAAAAWVEANLPADARVATDRTSGAVLAALSDVHTITNISDKVYVTPILLDQKIDGAALDALRRGKVDYVVVDRRLANGLPRDGIYVERGDGTDNTTTRVALAALEKFAGDPRFDKVFDDGVIAIYGWRP